MYIHSTGKKNTFSTKSQLFHFIVWVIYLGCEEKNEKRQKEKRKKRNKKKRRKKFKKEWKEKKKIFFK